ncbi:hypothetical protein JB92DRAFT_3083119 [Gautieria morchelliformis]|nr:hypothetical protein JB92DRAFT_3083119 [Gautieria morchelliformis]
MSDELVKYGLATLDKILKVFVDDQCVGCDVACSFYATVQNSSLAMTALTQQVVMALNSFHGHAHGRQCQLRCHPMYLCCLGLEDLVTCEHGSYFHYLQFIDLHFQQWDDDKYLELTNFILNNYQQAFGIIRDYTPEVKDFREAHGFTNLNFVSWCDEEFTYLSNLRKRLPKDTMRLNMLKPCKSSIT